MELDKKRKRQRRRRLQQGQRIIEELLDGDNMISTYFSDSEEGNQPSKSVGSIRNPNKEHNHVEFHQQLMKDCQRMHLQQQGLFVTFPDGESIV